MRVESLTSRLEFNERRARALESVVVYRPAPEDRMEPEPAAREPHPDDRRSDHDSRPAGQGASPLTGEGPGQRSRRRRRRRGRRGGGAAAGVMNSAAPAVAESGAAATSEPAAPFEPQSDPESESFDDDHETADTEPNAEDQ
jgi:hypothetical protein